MKQQVSRTLSCVSRLISAIVVAITLAVIFPLLSGCGETQQAEPKISCRSPDSEKQVPVFKWKFDAIREALLKVVPTDDNGVETASLRTLVTEQLPEEHIEHLGNIAWLTESVRLEMEVRGELTRVEGSKPTRIRRPSN